MRRFILLILLAMLAGSAQSAALRELRGAWVVTTYGLDWPQRQYDPELQQQQMRDMLDRLALANFNTVFVEMQIEGDVLWSSLLQPAAADVTGSGEMPLPYDVARTFIDEAHERGLDIYAIIKPLGLGTAGAAERYAKQAIKHPILAHPELTVNHNGRYYLNPGNPDAAEYLHDLYTELVTEYPFDGILVDAPMIPPSGFDDEATYSDFNFRNQSIDDWRRDNLTDIVYDLRDIIDTYRPNLRLALATDALTEIDDQGRQPTVPSYVELLDRGVIDMVVPKLFARAGRGFAPALDTWTDREYSTRTVAAITPELLSEYHRSPAPELQQQIELTRQADDSIAGVVIYRVSMLTDPTRPEVLRRYSQIRDEAFLFPAHQPLLPTLPVTTPYPPENVQVSTGDETYEITWETPPTDALGTPIRYYTIYIARDGETDLNNPHAVVAHRVTGNEFTYQSAIPGLEFAVTTFDANYCESLPSFSPASGTDGLQERPYIFRFYSGLLYISGAKVIDSVDIYNSWGAHTKHFNSSDFEITAECSDLQSGVYVVHTRYADGSTRVNKFVK